MSERQAWQKETVAEGGSNQRSDISKCITFILYSFFLSRVLRVHMCTWVHTHVCMPLASATRVVIAGCKGAGEFTGDRSVNRRRPSRQSARKFHCRRKNRDNYGSVVAATSVTIHLGPTSLLYSSEQFVVHSTMGGRRSSIHLSKQKSLREILRKYDTVVKGKNTFAWYIRSEN